MAIAPVAEMARVDGADRQMTQTGLFAEHFTAEAAPVPRVVASRRCTAAYG